MTGAPIDAKNTEVSVVAVEVNNGEDITTGAKDSKINNTRHELRFVLKNN